MFDDSGSPSSTDEQPAPAPTSENPAVTRFRACRWHERIDGAAEYCSHRDVLPYAGKHGFKPEAWCPDCTFYKVRRTVKKRDQDFEY